MVVVSLEERADGDDSEKEQNDPQCCQFEGSIRSRRNSSRIDAIDESVEIVVETEDCVYPLVFDECDESCIRETQFVIVVPFERPNRFFEAFAGTERQIDPVRKRPAARDTTPH